VLLLSLLLLSLLLLSLLLVVLVASLGGHCGRCSRCSRLVLVLGRGSSWGACGRGADAGHLAALVAFLAKLGPPVLEPHLNARLGQHYLGGRLLAQEHVRILRLLEETL